MITVSCGENSSSFGGFVLKRCVFILITCLVTGTGFADALWQCTAINKAGTTWYWYGHTQYEARKMAQKHCSEQNGHACAMVCFPPKVYYRCFSHDTLPVLMTNDSQQPVNYKQGTWYWSSSDSKQIAINGARDACRHNSPFGGCYVDPNQCAAS